jgi:hypothetical protein
MNIKIQKMYRGYITRTKRMPNIMYKIKYFLQNRSYTFSNQTEDGRVNSSLDEVEIADILISRFGNRRIKKMQCRMWYDIKVFDKKHGWLPVNIKTTSMNSSDNTGNFAMCVYAYTDEELDLDKKYTNGEMADLFYNKLLHKKYNMNHKKDYYFLVLNKKNNRDIIINSVKGLTCLTPNSNNLPFQVCWNKNRSFNYEHINIKINNVTNILKQMSPNWKEKFINNIRNL